MNNASNNFKTANNYMLATLLCIIFVSPIIINIILKVFNFSNYNNSIWLIQILASITYLVIPFLTFQYLGFINIKKDISFKRLSLKNIILIILISITMQPLLSLIATITNIFNKDEVSEIIFEFYKLPYWQTLLAVAVTPALIEEFIFRGIILSKYKKSGLFVSILISSLYFGIIHLTISQLFYAIVGGIILGFLVKATDSIWAGVLGHFVLNGSQITMGYISYNSLNIEEIEQQLEILSNSNNINSLDNLINSPLALLISSGIIFLIVLPIFLMFIILFAKLNKKELCKYSLNNNNLKLKEIFSPSFFIIILIYLIYML